MNIASLLLAAILLNLTNTALALDIKPYTPQTLSALQQADQPVALHFHADWCPTCRAQERIFNRWRGDASVPGTLLIVNYDNERALRRQMGVHTQSTVIAFKGLKETGRLAGNTSPQALRDVLGSAR